MASQKKYLKDNFYGGTIRLGASSCLLKRDSLLYKIYKQEEIFERHRHRYEFNNDYKSLFEKKGIVFGARAKDEEVVEAIEIKKHPFFIATQFHPEYKSRFLFPHPLFKAFVKACLK